MSTRPWNTNNYHAYQPSYINSQLLIARPQRGFSDYADFLACYTDMNEAEREHLCMLIVEVCAMIPNMGPLSAAQLIWQTARKATP